MSSTLNVSITSLTKPASGTLIMLAGPKGKFGPFAAEIDQLTDGQLSRAAAAAKFSGKARNHLDVWAPAGLSLDRIILVGCGKMQGDKESYWLDYGGRLGARLTGCPAGPIHIALENPLEEDGAMNAEYQALICAGMAMRAYKFDRYKSDISTPTDDTVDEPVEDGDIDDDGDRNGRSKLVEVAVAQPDEVAQLFERQSHIVAGSLLARDLVNEPANTLGTVEFAAHAEALRAWGVTCETLDETAMRALKMDALLGVAQGSNRPPRLVIMRWDGGEDDQQPVAFVGKGVVFDSGGISLKPAGGMEDMKGDMGGAAAVVGLMRALAGRKAKVNAVGIIGLVENMPDAGAQRPGDIVRAMSGQTIEILNTDAEGRLVLADALWYCQQRFAPRFVIDLATLTGAVIVALGKEYAGMFSNDDSLAEQLFLSGDRSGEKLWRLPLAPAYDKLIEAKTADIKNTGGRNAGAITAAQFLKRFIKDVPWAHLDVAGTAMAAPKSPTNQSWGSGFGVRLLDQLIADYYE